MRQFTIIIAVLLICACSSKTNPNYVNSAAPLKPSAFIELPLGSISAEDWLKEMLIRQKNGATGHLDEMYSEVMGERNGWLGGDGDQWERGPYWIDGLLPLAYILKDSSLIAKTTPWIEWALNSQKDNGYFGPDKDYPYEAGLQRDNCQDWWPRMVVLKVLQQYYSATADRRVIDLMTAYFKYQLENLSSKPLDNWTFWARFRGGDNLMMVYWLYNITKEKFLLDLGEIIYNQTEPYTEIFLEHKKLSGVGTIHSVNLAQGIKTPIIYYQFDQQQKYLDALECALDDLHQFQGYPTGMFSGDEAIHGNDPTQGTELCTIVEYLYSLETMYKITANPRFAELIERIAYNALPCQTDDDYTVRQYFQQVNQIRLQSHQRNFDVNHDGLDAMFGLMTGYPCCTSNMHQAWPKLVQNLWYATADAGIAATIYAPSSVRAKVADGVEVTISEKTKYPFEEKILFTIESIDKSCQFPFLIRIPSWSRETSILLNGKKIDFATDKDRLVRIDRVWSEADELELIFTPEIELTVWKENARAVERGPLVYALHIESQRNKIEVSEEQGSWCYEDIPATPWNYALMSADASRFELTRDTENIVYPWNYKNAPLRIFTTGARLPQWREYNMMAGPIPYSIMYGMEIGERERIELIPYGCTTLRITEFPVLGNHSAE